MIKALGLVLISYSISLSAQGQTSDRIQMSLKPQVCLLAKNEELSLYKHNGFWACMDTQRDLVELNRLWESGNAPWII